MGYFTSVLNTFFYLATTIKVPIPLTTEKVVYVSLFTIMIVFAVFCSLIYFFKQLTGLYESISQGILSDIKSEVHTSYKNSIIEKYRSSEAKRKLDKKWF